MKPPILMMAALLSLSAFAKDVRDQAILDSPMTKAILHGLEEERGLKCVPTYDESHNLTVNYTVEEDDDGVTKSMFEAFFSCNTRDGLNAVIKGVMGDGSTETKSFRMQKGVN